MVEIAHYRIVFEQVRERFGVGQVIYRNQVDVSVAEPRSDQCAANPAKSVYTYFYCHS